MNQYVTIGAMSVPALSIRRHQITYEGQAEDVFFGYASSHELPTIQPNRSALTITETNSLGKPVRSYVGVITSVRDYAADPSGKIKLTFNYLPVTPEYPNPEITTVKPVISRIWTHGPFAALLVEGEVDATSIYIDLELSPFYHGNNLYYKKFKMILSRRLDPENLTISGEERLPVGQLVISSTQKLPSKFEMLRFCDRALYYFGYPMLTPDEQSRLAEAMGWSE